MTQEEKQLLIRDLCARLPYHPHINVYNDSWEGCQPGEFDTNLYSQHIDAIVCDRIEIKPYLRLMSSMTEEEKEAYCDLQDKFLYSSQYLVTDAFEMFDWLNKNMFDYRGLIEKGLALEALTDMYKID